MKKLLFAASAVALAAAMSLAVTAVQAAPTKSPYCAMAKTQKNLVSWNAYYHCLGQAPRAPQASVQHRRLFAQAQLASAKSPYCAMAKTQKNLVSWNAYYHCLSR